MTKLTKWEKEELLRIYKRNRANNRCNIVKELTDVANELTKKLDDLINTIKTNLQIHESERDKILTDNKLSSFESSSQYTCKIINLHPELIVFDKETDEGIQRLIHGDFEGNITE